MTGDERVYVPESRPDDGKRWPSLDLHRAGGRLHWRRQWRLTDEQWRRRLLVERAVRVAALGTVGAVVGHYLAVWL